MRRAGAQKLPPHVLAAVEEKARLRRIDEQAHFWNEVEAAETGVGGAKSHGRCLPDTEEELFPNHVPTNDDDSDDAAGAAGAAAAATDGGTEDGDGASARRRREELADAYDEIPVSVEVSAR